ncbi:hypothetical protein LGH70_09245 [Hymenobacter sp. BT635]|uniref:Uncharacterized protein n=1 Tax=Hymenobacter nitidus TaxID=2880929 RepID=A0ABS8AEV7_9BACT|nr:hypothetical protein [Hymenobacter nitidus]MCB2377765.1 hypothetical protein [Hymenobacter nitidus]
MPAADTLRFPATYATALPALDPSRWEQDYARYQRFLTPEIKRTQQGLSFTGNDGVRTWWCQPSANPHAQLDTTTRIQDPARLLGHWRSVANRRVMHIDSFSVKDQKFYRSAVVREQPGNVRLQVTDQKFSFDVDLPKPQHKASKYTLVSQRYLLMKGAVTQVGLDAQGRLLLHTCAVTERQIPGRYLTYQTIIWQTILAKD